MGGLALGLAVFTLVAAIAGREGRLTARWATWATQFVGWGLYPLAIGVGAGGVYLVRHGAGRETRFPWVRALGIVVLLAMLLGLTDRLDGAPAVGTAIGHGSGQVGAAVSSGFIQLLGSVGGVALMLVLAALGLSLALEVPLSLIASWVGGVLAKVWRATRAVVTAIARVAQAGLDRIARFRWAAAPMPSLAGGDAGGGSTRANVAEDERPTHMPAPSAIPSRAVDEEDAVAGGNPDLPWELPRLDQMLDTKPQVSVSVADLRSRAKIIEDTCRSLGVPVTVVEVSPGPVVTQFGLEPGYLEKRDRSGGVQRTKVKVSRIAALANDLALALAAAPVRIEAPVRGAGGPKRSPRGGGPPWSDGVDAVPAPSGHVAAGAGSRCRGAPCG